ITANTTKLTSINSSPPCKAVSLKHNR
ncbi:iron/manganese superoxide dismutase, partial [Vibrio parahaemolyticus V-223/04]